jgi:hypothetical protein
MVDPAHLEELSRLCGEASVIVEGGVDFISLPRLRLPDGCNPQIQAALLCTGQHAGYTTRLLLASPVPGRGAHWTTHMVAGRFWHTWSWNQVPAGSRPAEILAEHLRGLR